MTIEKLKALHAEMGRVIASMSGGASAPTANGGGIADDRELDSQFGDPTVKFDPKRWTGPSMKGRRYSECPSDFLTELASFLEWSAANPKAGKDPKYADYDRKDAARARGWAQRNAGKRFDAPSGPGSYGDEDTSDLPF
jgi:hypothetical protein